ncbi:MAG: hypothetical protein ACFFCD_12115 [Promethearchaeota archaeon]
MDIVLLVNGTRQQTQKIFAPSYQTINTSFFWTPERNGVYTISLRVYDSPVSFEQSKPITIHVDSITGHQKYTMALYHFNVQFVPGSTAVENRIMEESFYPLLKMYQSHSKWRCNIELSGYMLELLHQRYPEVLSLLKELVREGQIEIVVSHYSEQFLVAYPRTDMAKSIEISDALLDALNLVRSGVFFAQESQWTPGYAGLLNAYDYDTVVVASDPWYYYLHHRMKTRSPLFFLEDNSTNSFRTDEQQINVLLLTKPGNINGIDYCWAWAYDGEAANTYSYVNDFHYASPRAETHEKKLKKLETEGYHFVFISEFVTMLDEMDVERTKIPNIPEATWDMDQCEGVWRWMGDNRAHYENDAFVRAYTYQVRQKALVAETLLNIVKSKGIDVSSEEQALLASWKKILLAEVSDSTGWTPLEIEVKESIRLTDSALKLLADVISDLKIKLGYHNSPIKVDPSKKTISKASISTEATPAPVPRLNIEVKGGPYQISYTKGDYGTTITINVALKKPGTVKIIFPAEDSIMYSPSLAENTLLTLNPFDIHEDPYLPLSNGLVVINSSKALIKHCAVRHMAMQWDRGNYIIFKEKAISGNLTYTFTFVEAAIFYFTFVDIANSINVHPYLII